MFKHGFVLGKFMPPHKGHVFLCEFARRQCEELTILVGSLPNEPIPGELRFEWMKQLFPTCNVVWCNEVLPQEPRYINDEEFWDTWSDAIYRYTGRTSFDAVFASESYGIPLSICLEATFIPCDVKRETVRTSGTKVRENPESQWKNLPDIVKPYFQKRVTLFGPESTGKTTVGQGLARMLNTLMVPEYGRLYTEAFGPELEQDELRLIADAHLASLAAARPNAGLLIIEDTDPVMTAVWSDMLFGKRDPWFDEFHEYSDLYLLFDVDIPWVDDGTRYFKNDDDRRKFFHLCETELRKRGVSYRVIRGQGDDRLWAARDAIFEVLYEA